MPDAKARASGSLPEVVAHRGNAGDFPENTLPAIASALELGVRFVEFDIQLTADARPVVFHDETLRRTTGSAGKITELPWRVVRRIPANEPGRFADRHPQALIPSLEQVVALVERWPRAFAFVEIKKESVEAFGVRRVMGAVLSRITPIHDRCALISFERDVLDAVPADLSRGWVLRAFDGPAREDALSLAPDFLFINGRRLPRAGALWPGTWQWCVYDIPDVDRGLALHRRGAALIETAVVRNYTDDPRFAAQSPP